MTEHIHVGVIHGHGADGSRLAASLGHDTNLTVSVAHNAWETLSWLADGLVDGLVYVSPSSPSVAQSVVGTVRDDSDLPVIVVSDRLAGRPAPDGVAFVERPRTEREFEQLARFVHAVATRDDLPVVADPGALVPVE